MPHLDNQTRFAANTALLYNEEGIETLYIVVKATFTLGRMPALADEQPAPFATDVYWGEPGRSSLKYAADVHTGKAATDIVMLGHACLPERTETTVVDVSLAVGAVNKTVRVFGDRYWQEGRITAPAAFTTMPMIYENAFGGAHIVDDQVDSIELRNPVGKGYAGTRTAAQSHGLPLPNIEDPAMLIRNIDDRPVPACFGFSAPSWHPRALLAGTYDEAWREHRAPYLPQDFDRRALNSAHPDLVYPGFLFGGEPVRITHMHPAGAIEFDIPRVALKAHVDIAGKTESAAFNLETLLLEPNRSRVSLVFRAALSCDKKSGKIDRVKIALTR